MATAKMSISLDERLKTDAQRAADDEGVTLSAWTAEAIKRALKIRDGLAAVDEYIAEHGDFDSDAIAWAERVMAEVDKPREWPALTIIALDDRT